MRTPLKFEKKKDELLPLSLFYGRMVTAALLTASSVGFALLLGVLGYKWIAGLSWMDALLNASMILTGMGPIAPMTTNAAKLFASLYAIFSGVVFLSSVGVFLSPMFHRMLHAFHIEDNQ